MMKFEIYDCMDCEFGSASSPMYISTCYAQMTCCVRECM